MPRGNGIHAVKGDADQWCSALNVLVRRLGAGHPQVARPRRIKVENPTGAGRGVRSVTVNGQPMWDEVVPLRDDGQTHDVQVVLG